MQHERFHEWFRLHVSICINKIRSHFSWIFSFQINSINISQVAELVEGGEAVPMEIKILAEEPIMVAQKYSSYTINGFNFHTHSYDQGRPVQSSGVALVAQTSCFERGGQ